MKKVFNFKAFKHLLVENNLKISEFAKLANISRQTVYSWDEVDEIKNPTAIMAIERILHVKYEDLCIDSQADIAAAQDRLRRKIALKNAAIPNTELIEQQPDTGIHDHKTEWPIIGNSRGGEWLETIESGYPGISEDWTPAPHGVIDENGYALRMLGDSMIPEFPEGGVILVSPNGEVLNGSFAVVIIESRLDDRRESCVKKVSIGNDVVTLHSLNPKYPDLTIPRSQVIAMHKIVECRVMTIKRYE